MHLYWGSFMGYCFPYDLGSADGRASSSGGTKLIRCRRVAMLMNVLDLAKFCPGHALLPTQNGMILKQIHQLYRQYH